MVLAFLLAAGSSGSRLPVGALREVGRILRVFEVRGQSELELYLFPCPRVRGVMKLLWAFQTFAFWCSSFVPACC